MTDYLTAIARAADNPRTPSPVQLRQAQAAMWARHRFEAWRIAPIGALSASMVTRGPVARVRRVESRL